MTTIRPYQTDIINRTLKAWRLGIQNVLLVLPTGAGKTYVFSNIVSNHGAPAVAIAHRQEIVSQISLSFGSHGVRHKLIAAANTVKNINKLHVEELSKSMYHPQMPTAVAGVDTLIRKKNIQPWCDSVTLCVQDEAHHVLKENKWGKAFQMFNNARGLGVTATPIRADGKGLGRHADGLFDIILTGPSGRELINAGYLSEYRIFAPPSNIDFSAIKVGSDGDFTRQSSAQAVKQSKIIGDVVSEYVKHASGKLGITFAPTIELAEEIARNFNAANVPAVALNGGTSDRDRMKALRDFRNRKYMQLVNVDLFGEGFDVPAVEVVSMARPTQSYAVYSQQFGRALRVLEGKSHAIIIDHVGNVLRHGLPDREQVWSLDRRERRRSSADNEVVVKVCPFCSGVYERYYKTCPYCGKTPVPAERSGPEFVDGDLTELDAETLARMRGEAINLDTTRAEYLATSGAGMLPAIAAAGAAKQFERKQAAQRELRDSMALWAGLQRAAGRPDSESYRRFYVGFGVDVLSAQALKAKDADELKIIIDKEVNKIV